MGAGCQANHADYHPALTPTPTPAARLLARLQVVSQEGLGALTIGFGPTMWRNTIWNSMYYGTMHWLQVRQVPTRLKGRGRGLQLQRRPLT